MIGPGGGWDISRALATGSKDVTGVEAEASCAFHTSLRAGRLVTIVPRPTLADGLGGNPDPETITFAFIQRFVDRIVTVSDEAMGSAIRGLIGFEHVIAEGAGAAGVAAVAAKRIDLAGRHAVVIVSGANIDRRRLASLVQGD